MKLTLFLIPFCFSQMSFAKMNAEDMSRFFYGMDILSEGVQIRAGTQIQNPLPEALELSGKLKPCQTIDDESPEGPANYYEISGDQCPLKFTSLASYMGTEDGSIMTDTKEVVEIFSPATAEKIPLRKLDLKKRWRFMLNNDLHIEYQERFVKGLATLWTGEEIEYKTSYKENKPLDENQIEFQYEVTIHGDHMNHRVFIEHTPKAEICSLDEQSIPCDQAWNLVGRR